MWRYYKLQPGKTSLQTFVFKHMRDLNILRCFAGLRSKFPKEFNTHLTGLLKQTELPSDTVNNACTLNHFNVVILILKHCT